MIAAGVQPDPSLCKLNSSNRRQVRLAGSFQRLNDLFPAGTFMNWSTTVLRLTAASFGGKASPHSSTFAEGMPRHDTSPIQSHSCPQADPVVLLDCISINSRGQRQSQKSESNMQPRLFPSPDLAHRATSLCIWGLRSKQARNRLFCCDTGG